MKCDRHKRVQSIWFIPFTWGPKQARLFCGARNQGYVMTLWALSMSSLMGSSVQFSSVAQSCPTLCDPMNHSTPGLPVVHHHLPEFTQTQVHRVRDAIQPSHPRSSPSPPAPNPSQHQSFFSKESTLLMRWPAFMQTNKPPPPPTTTTKNIYI